MQTSECRNILQTGKPRRETGKNANTGREKVRRIPPNHRLAEREAIAAVNDGELEIDDKGRVWRVMRMQGDAWGGESRLIPIPRKRAEHRIPFGYFQVHVQSRSVKGKRIHSLAHRLVWQYFFGNLPPGICINHKNGNKTDNRPSNLELSTYSANMKHAYRTGLADEHGERNPHAKLTNKSVALIRKQYAAGGVTQEQLGAKFNVAFQTISKIVRGDSRQKQTGKVADYTARRQLGMGDRDPHTGRFIGKTAGRELDGKIWDQMPRQTGD